MRRLDTNDLKQIIGTPKKERKINEREHIEKDREKVCSDGSPVKYSG